MAAITIRRLDDGTLTVLKARAKAAGRSMEEEIRLILNREAASRRLYGKEAVDYFTRVQKERFGDRVLSDSVNIIREIRNEDPTSSSAA